MEHAFAWLGWLFIGFWITRYVNCKLSEVWK